MGMGGDGNETLWGRVGIRAVHGNGNPRGNGNTFGLWTGMGMGILSREWEWRIFLYVKKFPLLVTPNVSRELTSFLTQQHAVTDEEEN